MHFSTPADPDSAVVKDSHHRACVRTETMSHMGAHLHLLDLPDDILREIVSRVTASGLVSLSRVNKALHQLANQDEFWEKYVRKNWKPLPELRDVTWHDICAAYLTFGSFRTCSRGCFLARVCVACGVLTERAAHWGWRRCSRSGRGGC